MLYHYKCDKCGKKIDKNYPMGSAVDSIDCECGGKMVQDILGKRIQSHLPLDYRATETEYHSVDYGDDDSMETMLNR